MGIKEDQVEMTFDDGRGEDGIYVDDGMVIVTKGCMSRRGRMYGSMVSGVWE